MSVMDQVGCRRPVVAALAVFLASAAPAFATPAIVDFQTAGYQNANSSEQRTVGWIFTALDDIAVTHLGIWDGASDGLDAAHLVGIWDAAGLLLGSTTVQAGTTSTIFGAPAGGGSFRYERAPWIALQAGATYTIGALYDSDDIFEFNAAHVDTSPEIAFGEERYGDEGAGFVFPTDTFERWGLFGPNFQFVALPEPSTAMLAMGGLAGLLAGARPRRRTVVPG